MTAKKVYKGGSKSKWESNVKPKLHLIKYWRTMGLAEYEVAAKLHVCVDSFEHYKKAHPELIEALREGKDEADEKVVSSLLRRACGYEYTVEKVTAIPGPDGKSTIKAVERIKQEMPPSVTAMIFYLKNRCSGLWQDVIGHRHDGKIKLEDAARVHITQIFQTAIEKRPESDKLKLIGNLGAIYANGNGNGSGQVNRLLPVLKVKETTIKDDE